MRDHRIDFFRGLALITIFINHLPSNVLSYLTPKNYGLSDSAEVFVLIAGISAAYAYYPRFCAGDVRGTSERVIRRALTLYGAQLVVSVALLLLFAASARSFADPGIVRQNLVGEFLADPVRGSIGLATLGHQFGYFNMLPMYMTFLLALPAIMALARRSLVLVLGVSFAVYATAATFHLDLPNYPRTGGWFFNPLAWQFLFTIGFAAGVRLRTGNGVPYHPLLFCVAVLYLVASMVWVLFGLWGTLPDLPLPFFVYGVDKTYLTMDRLLHVLALAYVVGHSPVMGRLKVHLGAANPVVAMGRNSLAIFCAGTVLSMVGVILKLELRGGTGFDIAAVALGLAALWGLARSLETRRLVATPAASPPLSAALATAD